MSQAICMSHEEELEARNGEVPAPGREGWRVLNEGYHENKIHLTRGQGGYVEDCRGNRYLDTALGAGTHLLGHAHPVVVSAIREQAENGTLLIGPNPYAYQLARQMASVLPGMESFAFCNSGSEATMRAARIARAATGKKKIGLFGGSWHGGHDLLMMEDDYQTPEGEPLAKVKCAGMPQELLQFSVLLPYNHDNTFEMIRRHKDELAMVIIEPAQGSNPRDDVRPFLEELRRLTAECGILLCFDEMITGFRVALGGAQQRWGIEPDLATYGKTIGGGLPFGVVAGKKSVMEVVKNPGVFMGGTFSANPLVTHIGSKLLSYLIEEQDAIYPELERKSSWLRNEVNSRYRAAGIPLGMIGVGSFMRLLFTDRFVKSRRQRDQVELAGGLQKQFANYLLLEQGIYMNSSGAVFLCTAHDDEIVTRIAEGLCAAGAFLKGQLDSHRC